MMSYVLFDCFPLCIQWFNALLGCFNDLSPASQKVVADFLKLPVEDLLLVDKPVPLPEPVTAPVVEPERSVTSVKGVFSGILASVNFTKSGHSTTDSPGVISSQQNTDKKDTTVAGTPPAASSKITVYISRGSNANGHQEYEVRSNTF
jgi:hypothetical protein